MNSRKTMHKSVTILILVCILAAPAQLYSQCAVVGTTTNIMSTGIMFTIISKTLSMTGNCVTTMQNAFGCGRNPSATMANMLIATNFNTANPYCSWLCNCGPGYTMEMITIGVGDNLPVELMDFAVEDENHAEVNGEEVDP